MDYDNPYKDDEKDLEVAKSMDEISKTVFVPIYPLIAGQIKEKFNITDGNCIDIGSGPAALSIALARITNLQINAMDASKHSFKIAVNNIADQDLEGRIAAVIGKAEKLPFEDNFADLIISRGSIFFWDDLIKAFNEILRVLKPGGKTYIGGGFGNAELKEAIFEEMAKKNDSFSKKGKGKLTPENIERIKKAVEQSNVQKYDITHGDKGFWIHITKE
ncbi:MAG: class I SAM-dependent methyltransferase [Desulfobacteraceae bacterium]|nr:class I SAM-dependent methyltransferase [Desulfobacteraceae bacterium]